MSFRHNFRVCFSLCECSAMWSTPSATTRCGRGRPDADRCIHPRGVGSAFVVSPSVVYQLWHRFQATGRYNVSAKDTCQEHNISYRSVTKLCGRSYGLLCLSRSALAAVIHSDEIIYLIVRLIVGAVGTDFIRMQSHVRPRTQRTLSRKRFVSWECKLSP